MTSRALPPLVWSFGLSPRVILPSELFARLGREAQGTILAHELIHIRRGDHLVRLLELAATTVFWWHPVVWWASRQLRELEEAVLRWPRPGAIAGSTPDLRLRAGRYPGIPLRASSHPRPITYRDRVRRLIVQENPHADPNSNEPPEQP